MPQLDRFSYISQVIWLIITFLILYFILVIIVLPKLYKILRFRKTKIKQLRNNIINYEKELIFIDINIKNKVLEVYKILKILPEIFFKLVEKHLEEERVVIKLSLDNYKEITNLLFWNGEDFLIIDLNLCYLLDVDLFIKEKEKYEIFRRLYKN